MVSELDGLIYETEGSLDDIRRSFSSDLQAEQYFQKSMFNTSLDFCVETQKQFSREIDKKLQFIESPDFSEVIDNLLKELVKLDLDLDDKKYEDYEVDDPFFHKF